MTHLFKTVNSPAKKVSHKVEHFSKKCVKKWRHFSKRETKVTHLLIVDFRLVQHKKYYPEGHQHTAANTATGSRFHQMPVEADVSVVKRRNACPVCVWGTPKPIRGHYFRGREEYGGTQRKEEDYHEQRFLKKAFDKTKYRQEERDLMTGKKEKTISGAMFSAPNLEHNLRNHIPPNSVEERRHLNWVYTKDSEITL